MLRSAQMIMAQALSRHIFGTGTNFVILTFFDRLFDFFLIAGWRIPDSLDERRACADYCNVRILFCIFFDTYNVLMSLDCEVLHRLSWACLHLFLTPSRTVWHAI